MSIADTARRALKVLDRDGWNQGALTASPAGWEWAGKRFKAGSHCIGGAWNIAAFGNDQWFAGSESYQPLTEVIRDQYPEYPWSEGEPEIFGIAMWNNDPDTTETDVRALLEKLAAS